MLYEWRSQNLQVVPRTIVSPQNKTLAGSILPVKYTAYYCKSTNQINGRWRISESITLRSRVLLESLIDELQGLVRVFKSVCLAVGRGDV